MMDLPDLSKVKNLHLPDLSLESDLRYYITRCLIKFKEATLQFEEVCSPRKVLCYIIRINKEHFEKMQLTTVNQCISLQKCCTERNHAF